MTDEDKAALLEKLQAEAYRAMLQVAIWTKRAQELEQQMIPLQPKP